MAVAVWSEAWDCIHPLAGIVCWNPSEIMDVFFPHDCCVLTGEVTLLGWSLVPRNPIGYGVSNRRDRKAPQWETMTHYQVETPQEKEMTM